MFERELRDLAFVPRWSLIRTNKTQSVAEHSYFVAMYTLQICACLRTPRVFTETCLRYALWHDVEECFMGDVPGPVKRRTMNEGRKEEFVRAEMRRRFGEVMMSEEEDSFPQAVVKLADVTDEYLFLNDEQLLGNLGVQRVKDQSLERWDKALTELERICNRNLSGLRTCLVMQDPESKVVDDLALR